MRSIPDDATIFLKPSVVWVRAEQTALGGLSDGSQPVGVRTFTAWETRILERLAKGATRAELCAPDRAPTERLDDFLDSLQRWGPGALDWCASELVEAQADHRRTVEATRLRDIWAAMTTEVDVNDHFHRSGLNEPERQFDEVETTISHAFREPHAALGGRSYGEAFCDWLVANGRIKSGCRVIEIGCGLGFFANALLDTLARKYPGIYDGTTYTLFDLSPELQSAQRARCARHAGKLNFILGNIETHQFVGEPFDLVVSNEVIADLGVATISLESVENGPLRNEGEALAAEYQLECIPILQGSQRKAVLNVGAIKMLQNLSHCMGEGSAAVITEYGSSGLSPKAVQFENHKEFTVHFGHLVQVAERLGFKTSLTSMGAAIGFDEKCETIRMESFRTLSGGILPALGREPIPMLAYTAQSLRDAVGDLMDDLGNLQFLSLAHPASFSPFRFEQLLLSR